MQNPTVVADYTKRGYTSNATDAVVQEKLNATWRALVSPDDGVPDLPARIAAGSVDVELVKDVVSAATDRVLRNPEGYTEGGEAIDDFRADWKRGDASTDLYFTSAELRRVGKVASTFSAGSLKLS